MNYFLKAKKAFNEYIKEFDKNDGNVRLKIVHTYGVVKCSEYITSRLNLTTEDIELAKLIALLHDIGRFEQVRTTKSFIDYKGFDHAKYGVRILFDDGMIRNFIEEDKYDDVIYKAILNHNKLKFDENMSDIELLHTKIIRDADKLDNFRVKEVENFGNIFEYNKDTINYETITPSVYNTFMECSTIASNTRKTQIDFWISYIAFIFDLNFDVSLKYVKDNDYINKLVDRIEYRNIDTKLKMEKIRKFANEYLSKY